MTKVRVVTSLDLSVLKRAIDEAESWRGTMEGKDREEYESFIAAAREALSRVREQTEAMRKLRKSQQMMKGLASK